MIATTGWHLAAVIILPLFAVSALIYPGIPLMAIAAKAARAIRK